MPRHLRTAALSLLALGLMVTGQACASLSGHAPPEDSARVYQSTVLVNALNADGAEARENGSAIVARYPDIGVVTVLQPNRGKELIRMTTLWGKQKDVIPSAEWLLKVNAQNRDGIVKVYLDNDADLVTEWILEVHDGLGADAVAAAARVFATRSREVALAVADYIE
ncbi:MAG: hypothetical protein EP329_06110 [Deltaproteobacteria bacterium]|nr:MAG: hypothetical protein EP329_06110 [Deltaproteobacteria bacterium]